MNKKYYSEEIGRIFDTEERVGVAKQIRGVVGHYFKDLKSLKCLEVACSGGAISDYFAQNCQSVVGIDIDEKAILWAKSKFKRKNLSFAVMNAQKTSFKADTFDLIICNQTYNFVDNPHALMDEIYRILKPSGKVFFSARNKYALVEPQYKLPFLSWLPASLGRWYVKLLNKENEYFGGNYMSHTDILKLLSKFIVHDRTTDILRDPAKYEFFKLVKYAWITRIVPVELFIKLIPNYIFVLEKNSDK